MKNKFINATYGEYQSSLFGACFLSFGLGVIFASSFQMLAWPLIIIGIMMHGLGMYKIHSNNK